MTIQVNGESREIADGSIGVASCCASLGVTQPHVAVELNLEVVPRAQARATRRCATATDWKSSRSSAADRKFTTETQRARRE